MAYCNVLALAGTRRRLGSLDTQWQLYSVHMPGRYGQQSPGQLSEDLQKHSQVHPSEINSIFVVSNLFKLNLIFIQHTIYALIILNTEQISLHNYTCLY